MATQSKKHQVKIEGTDVQDEYQGLIAVWVLRMLLSSAPAFKGFFVNKRGFMDSDLQEFLQLSDEHDSKIKVSELRESLRFLLVSYEKKVDSSGTLFRNIALMSKRIHLNIVQQQILALVVLKERYEVLKDCFERLHTPGESHLYTGLAKVLDVDMQSIAKAMAGHAALRASGLIKLDENYRTGLDLEPMDGLCEALMAENENEQALLSHFLVPAKAATLAAADYPHVRDDFELLRGMLTASVQQQDKGVNILLYGTPGSGKTELARLLARTIGTNLFEVKTEDDDGDPVNANRRMEGYRFCQQMLSGDNNSLILFDEVEDVFPSRGFSFFGMEVKSGENKGWINKALEENKTPAITSVRLTNRIKSTG